MFDHEYLDDPGDPYGVMFEPDDPEAAWQERRAELREMFGDRYAWFNRKAQGANSRAGQRGCGGRINAWQVMDVFERAGGRCHWCGSLADQPKPAQGPWEQIGRRIGTIDHVDQQGVRHPGAEVETFVWNDVENLVWCCNWCNTWQSQRVWGATDHGGLPAEGVETTTAPSLEELLAPPGELPGSTPTGPEWTRAGRWFQQMAVWFRDRRVCLQPPPDPGDDLRLQAQADRGRSLGRRAGPAPPL